MDLRTRYVVALRRLSAGRMVDLSPSQLAEAACGILGAEAGGLVMAQELLRQPVGATSAAARVAEEIQASLGAGPCLQAMASGAALAASESDLAARWPPYHRALVERTLFRSTLSFPLARAGAASFAALNFYFRGTEPRVDQPLEAIQTEIADLVGLLLLRLPTDDAELPVGSDPEQVERRQQVWLAVGRVMEAGVVDAADALALLRARAFRDDLLLDDLAALMVAGRLTTADVLGPGRIR